MTQDNFDKDHVSTSKFYMFRCLVAMAHADGVISVEEQAYMSAFINRLPFTDEQRDILEADLSAQSESIDVLMSHINDPVYRGQLPYFARLMAYKDGNLHPDEEALLEKMKVNASAGLDMEAIRAEAKRATQAEMFVHDISIDANRPQKGKHFIPWFQWLDEILLMLGIDLMRD